jgi:large conductance mechanosensitive channel
MASNDPVLQSVGLTHPGSPKIPLGEHGSPLLGEFRDFALRGNISDMAVGIIIGVAFGRVINSLLGDLRMPPIGLLAGRPDFLLTSSTCPERPTRHIGEAKAAGAATINYGMFLNTVLTF